MVLILILAVVSQGAPGKMVTLTKDELLNKIKGGWAGQTIGCTFGGPTEFRFRDTIIQDYHPIPWEKGSMKWWYENIPGLYDDLYMDLTFVQVFEDKGLDAPASDFANAFAHAEYSLWHANQAGRYNVLNGIMPPESGHWLNNPHADDIDFQIESDFAGLMSPGMVNTCAGICDKIGHIMNYGDGWYGGVYLSGMYSLAFVEKDIHTVAEEALKLIPRESLYARVMADIIEYHKINPTDWKSAWFNVERKYAQDIGCPEGVFDAFDIDATINSAWVLIGLLYGDEDFGKTISIAARSGDDSDCNPSSAGGILGTLLGYDKIPEYWAEGLPLVEDMNFKYTTISLNKVYQMSQSHALELIRRNGGKVEGDLVTIAVQEPQPVRLEVGFVGHYPTEKKTLNLTLARKGGFEFNGVGFAVNGRAVAKGKEEYTFKVEMRIDGALVETSALPTRFVTRKYTPFWRYQLAPGTHKVEWTVLNPTTKAEIQLDSAILYNNKPQPPRY
ncbi:MAG TPA: ADP-ribosylglycohydrolase family protein [bacterium]|nr:ADP-ribosylglycohydrolase family protein [bacterium]HPR88475.1 ADP-ribosylglycohydrolase family protein [bacterium]